MNARQRCDALTARFYRGVLLRDAALRQGIQRRLREGARVLDAGCGRDAPIAAEHAARTSLCVGVDLVSRFEPPAGVRIVRSDLDHLPFPDETFDLIFSRSVIEHLQDPGKTFREFARVLKSGGGLVVVTPNKYDYASLLARVLPHRWHGPLLRRTQGEDVYDDFPTFFRCNTRGAVRRACEGTGLRVKEIVALRHYPYYLMFSVPLFYLGMAYDRCITALKLDFLQPSLFAELEKA